MKHSMAAAENLETPERPSTGKRSADRPHNLPDMQLLMSWRDATGSVAMPNVATVDRSCCNSATPVDVAPYKPLTGPLNCAT